MRNNWFAIEKEYIRVLGNDAQYLSPDTRQEMLISLKSLEWEKGGLIKDLMEEVKSLIEPAPVAGNADFAKNKHFSLCRVIAKGLTSMEFDLLDWDSKISQWRHTITILNYKPHRAIDYLSHFMECNLQIIDALLWLQNNLSEIKDFYSKLEWKYTTELDMYKEDWQKLLSLPTHKIVPLALEQIKRKRY